MDLRFSELSQQADEAAADRDFSRAVRILSDLTARLVTDASAWKRLAAMHRATGNPRAAITAITAALALEPRDLLGLLMQGSLIEALGEDAEEAYGAALVVRQALGATPPALLRPLANADRYKAAAIARRRNCLEPVLRGASRQFSVDAPQAARIERFADVIASGNTALVFSDLPPAEFFDPSRIPGLSAMAANYADYMAEYLALVAANDRASAPYVDHPTGVPLDQWAALNNSAAWSAAHLWRGGVIVDDNVAACPTTVAAFAALPVPNIAHRSPNLMFSILKPQTHIPRHVGVTNARVVVHVPLIIPESCSLTVGEQTKGWVPGEALVFDDTTEHEADNASMQPRVVLIGDAWHPDLTMVDRWALTEMFHAVAR